MNKLLSLSLMLCLRGFLIAQTEPLLTSGKEKEPTEILSTGLNYNPEQPAKTGSTSDSLPSLSFTRTVSLNEVVISATRWGQNSEELPFRITNILPSEIALLNPQTTADLLSLSGEVFIQKSQQAGGSPMIRGFATNRLLIVVDGIRMNNAIFRSGNIQNVISIDPFSLQRAEVLFGPRSVTYGSDAIGGVMNFITLQPRLLHESGNLINGVAAIRYSSANNELTAHTDLNIAWKKVAMTTSLTHSKFGDLRMGTNGPAEYRRHFYVSRMDGKDVVMTNEDPQVQRPTAYQQINLMQKVRFEIDKNRDLIYGFHYSTTTDYDRYDRLLLMRRGLPQNAEWRYGPQVWTMNHLTYSHRKAKGIYDNMELRLAHQFFEESRIDRNFNDPIRRTRKESVDAWSLNLDLRKSSGARHEIFYGIEWAFNDVKSTGLNENLETGESKPGPARYPRSSWLSQAAYFSWQFKVSPLLNLFSGLRYSSFRLNASFDTTFYPFPFKRASLEHSNVTGNLGMVIRPAKTWLLNVNFSSGFRAPNVDDMGKIFDAVPGSVVVPNPQLRPEYAWNAELGIAHTFGRHLKLDITSYYTLLEDALVRRNFQFNGKDSILYDGEMSQVQAIQNAAEARVWGIQTGAELLLPGGWSIHSRMIWQRGTEEVDNGETESLRHAAPTYGVARLNYSVKRLEIETYLVYSGAIRWNQLAADERKKPHLYALDAKGNPYSPGWMTLNFKAMYQLSDQWIIHAGVENITDQRYRTYSSGLAAAGRNFMLALRAVF